MILLLISLKQHKLDMGFSLGLKAYKRLNLNTIKVIFLGYVKYCFRNKEFTNSLDSLNIRHVEAYVRQNTF